eukprot:TRINITY_DN139_c0_g1_i11.p1 TRINITY_DN139_c0_g1~~TRINITY_DN139_c0_g1_i11.p1  ORF type:complete len:937 (-),score=64.55 TRINITY_DN139_c0_g1_i11:7171-9981(-)
MCTVGYIMHSTMRGSVYQFKSQYNVSHAQAQLQSQLINKYSYLLKMENPANKPKTQSSSTALAKSPRPKSEPVSSSDANKAGVKGTDSQFENSKVASNSEELLKQAKALKQKRQRYAWQIQLDWFIDNLYVQLFVSFLTVFALFADELRLLAFTKSADETFYTLLCITMGIFFLEIFLSSISKEDYFNGFFFWLDVISTLSIMGDVAWIMPESSSVGQTTTSVTKQARAGRAARIIRLIRLIRLVRITKLYKEAQKQREMAEQKNISRRRSSVRIHPIAPGSIPSEENAHRLSPQKPQDALTPAVTNNSQDTPVTDPENSGPKESKVSKLLSDLTTQRVVILILTLTFCLPLLDLQSYIDALYVPPYAVSVLADAHDKMPSADFAKICQKFCDEAKDDTYYPLVYVEGPDCGPYSFGIEKEELRIAETMESEDRGYKAVFDTRAYTKLTSGLSMGRTVFLCILLAVGAILFSHDTTSLVLEPLESMIEKVNKLSHDPMWFCLATEDEDLGIFSFMEKQKKSNEKYETQYLETLIVKIAKLLAVEFGEAGTKIIVSNLSTNDFLNPMVPGAKMCAVFGFCIINSFAEATELLQTKVILYLNQIAETVHSTVDKYLGSTNKNIGEAFLVLWKFQDDDIEFTPAGPVSKSRVATTTVDLALFAYLKIIAKINKLLHLLRFGETEEVKKKSPSFKLKMGFGLHVGWGIEGAIGSVHKIDASYLSPNVNISARLEAATKQYGVPILISGQVYEMLSPYVKKYCREIDVVTVKGSVLPLKLYTVDLNVNALIPKECKYASIEAGKKKDKRLKKRKQFHRAVASGQKTSQMVFSADQDLEIMRAGITQEFLKQYEEGYTNYISGNWNQAIESFRKVLLLRPNDGPTLTLLAYMDAQKGIAPSTWKGYRALTEKQFSPLFHLIMLLTYLLCSITIASDIVSTHQ